MKKPTVTVIVLAVLVMFSACGRKPGKITSGSRYVTPMMIQQIQETVDKMPDPKDEGTATEILKADVFSAFKRDGKKEEAVKEETKTQETAQEEKKEEPDKQETVAEQPKQTEAEAKPKTAKTNIDAVAGEETVYVSGSGKKFHKTPDCSGMKSPVAMTRGEAETSGKTYCKKCYE